MKRFLAPAALVFALAACAHVDYVGRSYAPTNKVDLFFDERDVRVDYEVMGQGRRRSGGRGGQGEEAVRGSCTASTSFHSILPPGFTS
jgi:hypothetical protein